MIRTLLLIVTILCYVLILTPIARAVTFCPVLYVPHDYYCMCTVHNYASTTDYGVTVWLTTQLGTSEDGPWNLPPGTHHYTTHEMTYEWGSQCWCKVTGETKSYTRTSLTVLDPAFVPIVAVSCQ